MEKLFSYGTLQQENVQLENFGRKLSGVKATLPGYVLSTVKIKDRAVVEQSGTNIHPILRSTDKPEDHIEGTIFDITAEELKQADAYEVDEYIRIKANFLSGHTAWVYVAADQFE